uniref:IST1-like protein n=1 Tax=Cajanus cajan TaxID=3821 RepID=A0A151RWG0_CAJCA|nr:IST1-like protein [Cajanus cajan]
MLSFLFGWSKASRCKKMIKRAQCRLIQLKNKRQVMATQLRKDLADLIQNGHEETAITRVDDLIQDESLIATYELLDIFFVFILQKLSYIRRHKDCPPDINEAVSSLIFASARCGDFPELYVIRKLFGQRYGKHFATAAVELFPGNLVNKKLIVNLSVMSLPDFQKYIVVDEIARDNCVQPKVIMFNNGVQVKEHKGNELVESDAKINHTIADSKINPSEVEEIQSDNTSVTSALSSVQQKEVEKQAFPDLQNKGEIMDLVPSSERVSLFPCAEAKVEYYVDQIEESQSFASKDGYFQDQIAISINFDDYDIDQEESRSEKSSTRGFRNRKGAPKKRLRRRSTLLEGQGIIEIGCIIYYQKPCKSHSTQKYGTKYSKMREKPLVEELPQSNYAHKRLKQHTLDKENSTESCQSQGNTKREAFNLDLCDCSLDQPCYCSFYYDLECCQDLLSIETRKGTKATQNQRVGEFYHCQYEPNMGMESVTILQKLNRETCSGATSYHLLTYPDYHLSEPNKEIKADTCESLRSSSSTNASNPRTCSSLARTENAPLNSRALTMTPELPKNCKENLLIRTYSCTSPQPKHVHPKLPQYEDIVSIFTALKREKEREKL